MIINTLDAAMLKKMFLGGAYRIEAKKEYINELNVFPVPDGDTGTNMSMTIMAAAKEVGSLENPSMTELAKAISSGSLRGARGNSGVILSQLFRGFTKEIMKYETLDTRAVAMGFEKAVETAYKAVMKPKEGTILTVAKETAVKALEVAKHVDDFEKFGAMVLEHAEYTLSQTPEMLPVLKEAGVVDSGGQGLLEVLKGAFDVMLGKEPDYEVQPIEKVTKVATSNRSNDIPAEITFGYCTEFIVMLEKEFTEETEREFKEYLTSIGDSIVVVSDDEIVKVHVHTNHPGLAFEKGLTYGSLSRMKVDNMREEHEEKLIKDAQRIAEEQKQLEEKKVDMPHKDMGFIAVSIGEGINEIFKGLGVDYLIEGGQTMNPSTEDMLNAIEQVNADHIFILPNNKNIILAAEQAKELVEDKEIIVLPTKTIPQGISAVISFVAEESVETNEEAMRESIELVKTGQVTYAVRDTSIDGKEIHIGDIMGIADDGIKAVGKEVEETALQLLDSLVDEESEIICLYYGEEVSKENAESFIQQVEEKYPHCDVELQYGGQPIYYYVMSVE
ncbi:MAG: DAK2 domain-containing protein [Firmicutes bacterium]|uniref:DAK2 domain-containing protein n=1 Tax=Candidatus Scybalomonas excrementavium TaxID=2840943 RepID=A0A9D9HYW9_9FIRM|nr:DAK2 domain-containing protein [Candidatus Scybalomonas excrementavium]